VLGRSTLPALASAGHDVVGLARSTPGDRSDLVGLDLFDREGLLGFARSWKPEAIVHLATAIPAAVNPRRIAKDFATTNRLRTEGTRNLAEAASEAGGAKLVSQSIGFVYHPGPGLAVETDPLWNEPVMGPVVPAIAELERTTERAGGTVLRFGQLYGPGTAFDATGSMGRAAATRRIPILRSGDRESTFSFIHAGDAAAAVVAALDRDVAGTFNVVDDDPAPVSEWLPTLAAARGGRPPRTMPALLARPLIGPYGVAYMTELRGASNAKAKAELGWKPAIPSWRDGF
jgi:nucleoside-diphosphate-sugar epimerase